MGLKASIRDRNEETTSLQDPMPENRTLWMPSMVASLLSKPSLRALAARGCKQKLARASQDDFMVSVGWRARGTMVMAEPTFPQDGECI